MIEGQSAGSNLKHLITLLDDLRAVGVVFVGEGREGQPARLQRVGARSVGEPDRPSDHTWPHALHRNDCTR